MLLSQSLVTRCDPSLCKCFWICKIFFRHIRTQVTFNDSAITSCCFLREMISELDSSLSWLKKEMFILSLFFFSPFNEQISQRCTKLLWEQLPSWKWKSSCHSNIMKSYSESKMIHISTIVSVNLKVFQI